MAPDNHFVTITVRFHVIFGISARTGVLLLADRDAVKTLGKYSENYEHIFLFGISYANAAHPQSVRGRFLDHKSGIKPVIPAASTAKPHIAL
jgi:hypothetical protein